MKNCCDLHTHSVFSDGSDTPTEIIEKAENLGLYAVALTDHNTLSGVYEFTAAAKEKKVKAVAGIEFSTAYYGREIHILALFVPEESFDETASFVKGYKERKEESETALIKALINLGYDLDEEKIFASAPNRNVNRVHIAKELLAKGYVSSVNEAFDRLLSKNCGLYKAPELLSSKAVIEKITRVGALPIIAHPLKEFSVPELDAFLSEAKAWGLKGLECYHSDFSEEMTLSACALAEKHSLLKSGGSDYHGSVKPTISLGSGKNNLHIPKEIYETLKKSL